MFMSLSAILSRPGCLAASSGSKAAAAIQDRLSTQVASLPVPSKHFLPITNVEEPKKQIFKMRPESLIGVYVGLDLENQKLLQCPPFLAFQMRITSDFDIEQMGDGFPCKDEAIAKEIVQIIQAKNLPVPIVVLFSWGGGFWIGTMSNPDEYYDECVLFCYNKPQKVGEQFSGFSLRHFKRHLGKPPEMVKEEMLPTTDRAMAEKLFQRRIAEIKAAELAKPKESSPPPSTSVQPPANLKESQLLVLSKAFPETVKILQSNNRAEPEEAYAAYRRDIFRTTGKMDEPLMFNQAQFDITKKALNNKNRRAKMGIDPIEYELVVGWYFRGYGNMPPPARVTALKKRGLHPPTADGIRKMCKRLKLPQLRKPGLH